MGEIEEIALLSFYNGILLAGVEFEKVSEHIPSGVKKIKHPIFSLLKDSACITIKEMFELGKRIQNQFPELKIPEILNEIDRCLQTDGYFRKKKIPGIFLLIGTNLPKLKFTSNSRIKKLL